MRVCSSVEHPDFQQPQPERYPKHRSLQDFCPEQISTQRPCKPPALSSTQNQEDNPSKAQKQTVSISIVQLALTDKIRPTKGSTLEKDNLKDRVTISCEKACPQNPIRMEGPTPRLFVTFKRQNLTLRATQLRFTFREHISSRRP